MWRKKVFSSMGKAFCIGCSLLIALIALNNCSSSDSGTRHGMFIDSAIEGLTFTTETLSGETDSFGRFSYEPGETVTFSIGGIILGSTSGKSVVTPLDLVAGAQDEKNPKVTNIVRLLITLDEDNNPENGIILSPELKTALADASIDFSLDPFVFDQDTSVLDVVKIVNQIYHTTESGERTICTEQDAQDHLKATIDTLAKTGYEHQGGSGGGGGGSGGGGCG
jgi:hypothetical protein